MAYLITSQDIFANTTIQSNVQATLLYPFIEKAQVMNVLKLLGTAQYEAIQTQINNVGLTGLTGTTLALVNQLKPMVTNYTWYYATPFLTVRFDNKGVNYLTSDNSETVSEAKINTLMSKILQFAQESELLALKFLRKNYQQYPLWREDIYYEEDCNNNAKTLFGGIQFDNKNPYVYLNGRVYRLSDLL